MRDACSCAYRPAMRRHLSFANVTSALALTLAISTGGAYAAGVGRNTVGTPQLKKDAVVSAKVKNGSLLSADFKTGQLPSGPRGPQGANGPQGLQGATGATGPRGFSAWDTIPSGTVLTGLWWYETTSGTTNVSERFWTPIAGVAPQDLQVAFAPDNSAATSGENANCTGSLESPNPPSGALCLFTVSTQGVDSLTKITPGGGANRLGFLLQVVSDDDNAHVEVYGYWTYRAP